MLVIPVSLKESGKQKENKLFSRKNLVGEAHYSKSHFFVQKFNFDQKPNIFKSFSPKFILTIFLVKSKLSTAKKSKTQQFHEFFTQKKKNPQISRESEDEVLGKKWSFEKKQKNVK